MLFTKRNPLCGHVSCQTTNFLLPSFFPGGGFEAIILPYPPISLTSERNKAQGTAQCVHSETWGHFWPSCEGRDELNPCSGAWTLGTRGSRGTHSIEIWVFWGCPAGMQSCPFPEGCVSVPSDCAAVLHHPGAAANTAHRRG